jgi:NAD(P)-dependent dehydrogenase (short-subunit alcohol dehydrogenase family)
VKTAIVTGAGSGIGRSVAQALGAAGFGVALVGRRLEGLQETALSVSHGLVLPADITDTAALDTVFAEVDRAWPRLDVLVNNAGAVGPSLPLEDVPHDDFAAVMAVNLTAAFWCAQHAVRRMKRQEPAGGRVFNIGSVSAHRPRPDSVAYCVSKHGLTGLTRSIALEGRAHGITCTQLDIGNARTGMLGPTAEATFDVAHVGTVVAMLAGLPDDVAVPELTILAREMPYLGRG